MLHLKKILTFLDASHEDTDNEMLSCFNQRVDKLDEPEINELYGYLDEPCPNAMLATQALKVRIPKEILKRFIIETVIGQDTTYAIWTLHWLLGLEKVNARLKCFINPKINKLFMLVLETDYAQAKLCYQKFSKHDALQGKGLLLAEGKTIVKAPIINEISSKITIAFDLQKDNPLGIVPLCVALFDTPEELAPIVIWMLDNGVSADELIATGLLSVFLVHNVNQIDMGYNLVNVFYDLLSQHDSEKTKELLAKTRQTKAYSACLDGWALDQGMRVSLPYIKNRSIDGTLHALTENSLTSVSFKCPQLHYQTSKENMAALFEYFGWRFLYELNYNSETKQSISDFIHYKQNEVLAIIGLLKYEQYYHIDFLVCTLRGFANLETCKKNLDMLHVLASKSNISLASNDIKTLVSLIEQATTTDKVKLQRLLSLNQINITDKHEEGRGLITNALLELIIKADYDNTRYGGHLKLLIYGLDYCSFITQFIFNLKKTMTQLTQLDPNTPFSTDVYISIERRWSEGGIALQRLKNLGFTHDPNIYGKYQLNVSILINNFSAQMNLDDLMSYLEIFVPPFNEQERLDEKHRTLIELFCAAVDSRLRDIAFAGLIELKWQGSQHKDRMIARAIRHNDLKNLEKLFSFDDGHKTKDDWLFDACKILVNDLLESDDLNNALSINSPEYFYQYFMQYQIIWVKAFCAVLQTKIFNPSFSSEIVHFFRMEIETKEDQELIEFVSYLHKQNQTTALSLVGEVIDEIRLERLFCSYPASLHICINLTKIQSIFTRSNILSLSREIKKAPELYDKQYYWYLLLVFLAKTIQIDWRESDWMQSLEVSLEECLEGLFASAPLQLDKEIIEHILTTLFINNRWRALNSLITRIDGQFDWALKLHDTMKVSNEVYYVPENCSKWMNKLLCKKPEAISTLINSYLNTRSHWPTVLIDKEAMVAILGYINSKEDLTLLSSFMNFIKKRSDNSSNFDQAYSELEDKLSDSIKKTKTSQLEASKFRKISNFSNSNSIANNPNSLFWERSPEAPPSHTAITAIPERTFTLSI